MQIIAKCPACSQAMKLDESAADKRIRCLSCQRVFKVPGMDELNKAVRLLKISQGTVYVDEDGKIYG